MPVITGLCCLALKPVVSGVCGGLGIGDVVDSTSDAGGDVIAGSVSQVVDFLYRRIRDQSGELFAALRAANHRAWQSLEVALAGESFWSFLSDRTDKEFRAQVRAFLERVPLPESVRDQADFRKQCVQDIQKARSVGLLTGDIDAALLSRDVGAFARFTDPEAIVRHRDRLAGDLTREIREGGFQSLAYLLAAVDVEESLLIHALRYYFNREQDRRPRLKKFLEELRWQHLQTGLDDGFAALDDVLERHGEMLSKLLSEATALRAEAREHYLDLKDEFRRLDERQAQANRDLYQNILDALQTNLRRPEREVRFSDSFSLRTENEYQFVKQLVAKYRTLPDDERRRLPALMNAVGKLEVISGDLDGAQRSFQAVAAVVPDRAARAEAHYNAYQASLQRGDWATALAELLEAVEVAPRYAPFPIERYQPLSILGAGGFGVAFLCRHVELHSQVVVKALMPEQLASSVEEVFREARVLDQLDHPCIIRLRECGYTDAAAKERPYFLLNYFEGGTLEQHVRTHGPLSVADAVALGRLIAQGLETAHKHGVLHRDVKPANVLVRKTGTDWQVKLIDFGLAVKHQAMRSTVTNAADPTRSVVCKSIAGTLEYAAPEQMGKRDEPVGPYSDAFGFGKTLCYALFQTPAPGPRHWLNLGDARLIELLGACLEEDPKARPQTFTDILARLGTPPAGRAGPPPPPIPEPPPKMARLVQTPIILNEPKPRPPSQPPKAPPKAPPRPPRPREEEPILLQVVDLSRDLAEYHTFLKTHGARGERLYLEQRERARQAEWKTAAKGGDPVGRFLLGLRLEHGVGVAQDSAAAAQMYRLAADAGLAEAQYNLAEMCALGQGIPADEGQALARYRQAAEKGHVAAQFTLGLLHQGGRGVTRDAAKAAEWFRKAAEKGHAAAQCSLGRLHLDGSGVPADDTQAFRWFHKAAEQGHPEAQFQLGEIYLRGRGVPRDKERAAYWYRKAAKQGHAGARSRLGP